MSKYYDCSSILMCEECNEHPVSYLTQDSKIICLDCSVFYKIKGAVWGKLFKMEKKEYYDKNNKKIIMLQLAFSSINNTNKSINVIVSRVKRGVFKLESIVKLESVD
jgi:hypothetical protein